MQFLVMIVVLIVGNLFPPTIIQAKYVFGFDIFIVSAYFIWFLYYIYAQGGIKAMFGKGKLAREKIDLELKQVLSEKENFEKQDRITKAELSLKEKEIFIKEKELEIKAEDMEKEAIVVSQERTLKEISIIDKKIALLEIQITSTWDTKLKEHYAQRILDLKKIKEDLLKQF